jgi:hypothetical protein
MYRSQDVWNRVDLNNVEERWAVEIIEGEGVVRKKSTN